MAIPRSQFLALIGQQPGERGRATKYDPDLHCDMVRRLAQDGEFPEAWAAEIGITLNTMRVWVNTHEEFSEAVIIARHLLQTYWTRELREARNNPNAKPGIYSIIARRFPEFYGKAPVDLWGYLHGQDPMGQAAQPAVPESGQASPQVNKTEADILDRLEQLRRRRSEEGAPE